MVSFQAHQYSSEALISVTRADERCDEEATLNDSIADVFGGSLSDLTTICVLGSSRRARPYMLKYV